MSMTLLKIIPIDTGLVPDHACQQQALQFLINHYPKRKIEIVITEEIEFIDPGGNFGTVRCNLCDVPITDDEWAEAMDGAYETKFTDLNFVTACCKQITSLKDLDYEVPIGFSTFAIVVEDANQDMSAKQVSDLETILQTKLNFIIARY